MFDIILAFITAFFLTYFAIPSIIKVSEKKGLFDEPGERRSHTVSTPSLGGIAIFAGTIFSIVLWTPFKHFGPLQYILCAFIIIFLIGAKDDIDPTSAAKKFLGQIFAAFILVFKADIRLTSLYGIFGVYQIPDWLSIILSVFTIIVIINAFNLIDGINGLSGSVGVLISVTLGLWFDGIDRMELSTVAFSLAGSTTAFLRYNVTPAKIFMGDTGSLLLGTVCSILAIEFIQSQNIVVDPAYAIKSAPSVAFGILILPLFDTLRVFIGRAIRGKSPFQPDRTHIHHLLLDSGMSHMQATFTLIVVNIFFIVIAYMLQHIGTLNLLMLIIGLAVLLSTMLSIIASKKRKVKSHKA